MKRNPLNLWVLSSILSLSAGAFAQQPGGPPRRPPSPEEQISRMKADLGLSDAQLQKIKPIVEATAAKLKSLHEEAATVEEQKREKARALRKEESDAVMAELTPEQKTKFEEELAKRRKNGPRGGGPGGPGESRGPGEGPK